MGLFTSRDTELSDVLVANATVRELQKGSRVDVRAALMALARVESNYHQDAKGDGGHAWGWWQVSDASWPVDTARVLGDGDYQIDLAAKVWRDAESAVEFAFGLEIAREASFTPAKDIPQLYNVAWQFGGGALRGWLSGSTDWTVKGFADYRDSIGKPVDRNALFGRAGTYGAEYATREADGPSFWNDVVLQTAKDSAALPSKGIGAVATAATSAATAAGDKAKSYADQIKQKVEDFVKWIEREIVFALVAFTLLMISLFFVLWAILDKKAGAK